MDPTVCWYRIRDALRNNDISGAIAASQDLHDWLHKGGFMPDIYAIDWRGDRNIDDCPLMRTSIRNHVWSVVSFLIGLNGEAR